MRVVVLVHERVAVLQGRERWLVHLPVLARYGGPVLVSLEEHGLARGQPHVVLGPWGSQRGHEGICGMKVLKPECLCWVLRVFRYTLRAKSFKFYTSEQIGVFQKKYWIFHCSEESLRILPA